MLLCSASSDLLCGAAVELSAAVVGSFRLGDCVVSTSALVVAALVCVELLVEALPSLAVVVVVGESAA